MLHHICNCHCSKLPSLLSISHVRIAWYFFLLSCHCRAKFCTSSPALFPPPLLPLTDNVDVLLQLFIIYVLIRLKVAHGHLGPLAEDRSNMVASYPTIQGMLEKEEC